MACQSMQENQTGKETKPDSKWICKIRINSENVLNLNFLLCLKTVSQIQENQRQ